MEEFFVPCTKQEEKEVVQLLQKLGYNQWKDRDAMVWSSECSGFIADEVGDYYVNSKPDHYTIVTLEELRQMVNMKQLSEAFDEIPTATTEIPYHVVKDLGFTEEKCYDSVHEREYGYPYKVFYLNLTDDISLDWNQVTRKARIIRCDKDGWIKNQQPIKSEQVLRTIVSFFKEDKK